MGFITDHFFSLITVLFFRVCSWLFFPGPDLTYLPYSPSYPHKYSTKLGTLLIIPYWHSYPNN
jgi:hypothetical protein